jgi:A-kinase anchor protein 1
MSPVEELIEIPAVYEFEVPQDIVGLLIGKQGTTIKWLTLESQAHIVIRQHFYSDRHKICTLEGTREQINKCLRLIRRKFPPSRFPDLKLTPIIPPPVTASHTPVWDNVIQLNLPEGVNCEVVISSIVNAGHFFLQQPTHPTFPSLNRLDQYMVAVYGQPITVPQLPRPVEMGVICAAPIAGGWYRAQTMDVDEDADEVLVKFVDYGGYSKIPISDLRQIRSDFMTLPFQATECYVAHVKPASPSSEKDGWSSEATALFEQLSQGKMLEASVTGHANDNIPLVELFLLSQDSKNMMINRLMAESGHAVWSD